MEDHEYKQAAQSLSALMKDDIKAYIAVDNHKNIMFYCLLALAMVVIIGSIIAYIHSNNKGTALAVKINELELEKNKVHKLQHRLNNIENKIPQWLNYTTPV